MTFQLPALPYAKDALSPHISEETLDFHYGKHHNTYVVTLNTMVKDTDFANMTLEEVIQKSEGPMFNNAAQIWNHTFYWNCLSPNGGGDATNAIGEAIIAKWSSFEQFKADFTAACITNFGSGWTWLVKNSAGEIEILKTSNAGCPLTENVTPLLTCDVWEHAYYIDYRNARPKYVEAFWNLVNWEFVNSNFA